MSLSLYDVSIPGYLRMLRNLDGFLGKAEAHAAENGIDLSVFTTARLAPDMYALPQQIHRASDAAKGGAARLAGREPPGFPDVETTFPELRARIEKTIAFVESIRREEVDGQEERTVTLKLPDRTLTFAAKDFVFGFSMPNFLFHVVAAYALLRSQGVPLGKLDYLA